MKVLFVINPVAGGNDHQPTIDYAVDYVQQLGFEPRVLLTTGQDDELNLARELNHFSPDRIIAGGGDGTIKMIVGQIMSSNITLGILPLGSANGLATALGLSQDPAKAIEQIFQSTQVRLVDLLQFNDEHLCVHVGDIGVNALIVKKYKEGNERGMLGYAKNLISSIQESQLLKMKISTSEGVTHKEGYMMAFANAHMYGTGVHISEGSVSDGKFEICNVERIALDAAIKAGLTILNVFIDKDMFSDVISCPEAEVSIDQPTPFQIDGEYIGMIDRLHIRILPRAIKLLV